MADKTIYLHGEFGVDILSSNVIPQIDAAIADKAKILTVDISSIGGSVKTGREIMGAIERAKLAGITIETQCLSFAYSMGANLFLMGTKGHRRLSEHAELMIHPVMGESFGNAQEMIQVATSLQEMSDNILSYITKGNESNSEAIKAAFEDQKMIGADEAISLGLADGYVEKLKAVAYYSKNTDMNEDIKKELHGIKALLANVSKFFGPKNTSAKAEGGETIYYEGSLSEGTKCFTDEAMTLPCADGTIVIEGTSYTVSGGAITSISAQDAVDVKALEAKIAELTTQLEAANAEKTKVENEKVEIETTLKAEVKNISEQFEAVSKKILGEEGRHKDEGNERERVVMKGDDYMIAIAKKTGQIK